MRNDSWVKHYIDKSLLLNATKPPRYVSSAIPPDARQEMSANPQTMKSNWLLFIFIVALLLMYQTIFIGMYDPSGHEELDAMVIKRAIVYPAYGV